MNKNGIFFRIVWKFINYFLSLIFISTPIPSEEPVTIISFPVKSFFIGFSGPLAYFLMKYNIIMKNISNNKRDANDILNKYILIF